LLTIGCDVNPAKGLNWVACAWTSTGACQIVDWGKYPEHDRPLWKTGDAHTEEQAIFLGISHWLDDVLAGERFHNAHSSAQGATEGGWLVHCGVGGSGARAGRQR
jgi:hypothetical protein